MLDHLISGRSLKVRRLLREQDEAGALPAALTISLDAKTGAGQDLHRPGCGGSTPPSCREGLQALQRCSGLLNRRARGGTVATHQSSRCNMCLGDCLRTADHDGRYLLGLACDGAELLVLEPLEALMAETIV